MLFRVAFLWQLGSCLTLSASQMRRIFFFLSEYYNLISLYCENLMVIIFYFHQSWLHQNICCSIFRVYLRRKTWRQKKCVTVTGESFFWTENVMNESEFSQFSSMYRVSMCMSECVTTDNKRFVLSFALSQFSAFFYGPAGVENLNIFILINFSGT